MALSYTLYTDASKDMVDIYMLIDRCYWLYDITVCMQGIS